LDGHIAVEGDIAGAVDDAHAAAADLIEQLVARRAGGDAGRDRPWLGLQTGVGHRFFRHGRPPRDRLGATSRFSQRGETAWHPLGTEDLAVVSRERRSTSTTTYSTSAMPGRTA